MYVCAHWQKKMFCVSYNFSVEVVICCMSTERMRLCIIKKKHAQHAPYIKYSNSVSFVNDYTLFFFVFFKKENNDIIWKNTLQYTWFQTTPIQSPCLYSESDILSLFLLSMEETNMLINIPALGHAGTGTRQTVWV